MQKFWIKDPVFRVNIYVVYGEPEESHDVIKKRFGLSDSSGLESLINERHGGIAGTLKNKDGEVDNVFFIWLNENSNEDIFVTLMHETFHLTSDVLRVLNNVPHDDSTEEVYAYYQMFYFNEILKKLKLEEVA